MRAIVGILEEEREAQACYTGKGTAAEGGALKGTLLAMRGTALA